MPALWLNRGAGDPQKLAKAWARFLHASIFENAKNTAPAFGVDFWRVIKKRGLFLGAHNKKHNKKKGYNNG